MRQMSAPRRRHDAVYRRRRVVAGAGVGLLVVVPWCVTRGGGEGAQAVRSTHGRAVLATCLDDARALSLRAHVGLLTMVGIDGDDVPAVTSLVAGADRPGGVFVRGGQAVWDDDVFADPPADGLPLLVAVDDEGGRVQPLEGILDPLPAAATTAQQTPEQIEDRATERGRELADLGITVVFAPVVDVGDGGGIGDRSFGDEAGTVVVAAGAYARGLRASGVLPVLKHFPGQGHASADTHDGPAVVPPLEELRTSDLVPYATLLDDGPVGVMVGHLDVPDLTSAGVPASLSPAGIGLLRAGYEFDGLVVTDDLVAMQAVLVRFGVPEAAERALAAGADLLLLSQPTDVGAVVDRLTDAVEQDRIPERRVDEALGRVLAAGGCG